MKQLLFNLRKKFIKAYNTGYLPERDGHCIYFQQVGNKKGRPVIMFHGGPGGCCKAIYASIFDLKKYRVIMFDQRGCGKSKFKDILYKNTTIETMKDALYLLDFLNIKEQVIAAGGSFGSTCAILFAQSYPKRVCRLVVNSIFLGRAKDAADMSPITPFFYPDVLNELQRKAGKENQFDYFYKLIFSKNRKDNEKAIHYYKAFEHQIGDMDFSFDKKQVTDEDIRGFRIFMRYQKNGFYIAENQLIKNAVKLKKIPTYIYQNRMDFVCPCNQAYDLHKAIPHSEFKIIADIGHGGNKLFYTIYKDSLKY